jgi:integrase
MARGNITPREESLALLSKALQTGIRGQNREAIQSAIEILEDDGKGGLTDLHYKRLAVGKTLRDPQRKGLWMRRNKTESVWLYNYPSPVTGKTVPHQFGTYPDLSLQEARTRWQELREIWKSKRDPFIEEEAEQAELFTVSDLCEKFIRDYAMDNKRSWKEDQRMFDYDLIRAYGDLDCREVSRDHIEDLLDEITGRGAPRSAEKLLTATRKLFNHAIRKRWVSGLTVNPCLHIELDKRETSPVYLKEPQIRSFVRNLPETKIPEVIRDILLLQFQTASRVGEVSGMLWEEVDLKNGIWTLPEARSKNKQAHRVMLSRQSLAILKRREKSATTDYVFPAERSSKPYPPTLVTRRVRENHESLGVPVNIGTHGLRHTALTQLASMGCGKELRDRISNHKHGSIDSIYQHYEHDYLPAL